MHLERKDAFAAVDWLWTGAIVSQEALMDPELAVGWRPFGHTLVWLLDIVFGEGYYNAAHVGHGDFLPRGVRLFDDAVQ